VKLIQQGDELVWRPTIICKWSPTAGRQYQRSAAGDSQLSAAPVECRLPVFVVTALYFATLLLFIPWGRLNAVALAITISGGFIFGSGLILAFFRDRLLALPERIKQREGVFRIFNWR